MTLKTLNIKIKSLIEGVIKKETMTEVGKLAKDLVQSRTLKGYGVKQSEGPKERLKGLSESYKKQRNRLKRQGALSQNTTPKKSNLTKTGKMLESLDSKASTAQAEVFLKTDQAKKKAEYQAEDGREFMNLSKTEINQIKKLIEQKLINDIKKKGL